MKKTIILLFIGSLLAGAGLLAGVAYAFGAVAEAGVRQASQTKPDEDATIAWQIDLGNYARGLLSSAATSRLHLESAPGGDAKSADLEGTPLQHVIYHGPLAMTPEGPKFCSYHIITTLQVDKLKDNTREKVVKAWNGASPFTIHTTTGFGGAQSTRIEVPSFSLDDEDGRMKFEGGSAKLSTGPDLAFARGDFSIGALNMVSTGLVETDIEISASSGSIDYVKDTSLTAKVKLGSMKSGTPGAVMSTASSNGEIDWLKGRHLKGQFTLGTMKMGGPGEPYHVVAGPGTVSVDYKRVSDAFDLLLGETKLHLEKASIKTEEQEIGLEDFIIRSDSGEKDGKLFGLVSYEVGGVQVPESAEMPLAFDQIAGKGVKVETGIEGLDLATVEALTRKGRDLPAFRNLSSLSQLSEPENAEKLQEAFAENSEALTEFSREMMGLIQPGLEIYYTARLRGETGISLAEVRLGMGGSKKLTEMKTAREMLASITGKATARASKSQFPPEMMTDLIAESPMEPYVAEHLDRFEFLAELGEGKLFVNGEATPLLDDLGPSLDEEFDWDSFFAGMAAGFGDAGSGIP